MFRQAARGRLPMRRRVLHPDPGMTTTTRNSTTRSTTTNSKPSRRLRFPMASPSPRSACRTRTTMNGSRNRPMRTSRASHARCARAIRGRPRLERVRLARAAGARRVVAGHLARPRSGCPGRRADSAAPEALRGAAQGGGLVARAARVVWANPDDRRAEIERVQKVVAGNARQTVNRTL